MKPGVFFYYVANASRVQITPQMLKLRGLADRIGECFDGPGVMQSAQVTELHAGPDDGRGALIVPMPADGAIVPGPDYFPDSQTWWQSSTDAQVWLGIDNNNPPNPAGIARLEQTTGYARDLCGDGAAWVCPIIRRCILYPAIPCYFTTLAGEGLRWVPDDKHAAIWKRSERWISGEMTTGDGLAIDEQIAAAVDCLALNYRIGPDELSALKILRTGEGGPLRMIIEAALDFPWLIEAQAQGSDGAKKKLYETTKRDLASCSRGLAALSQTIDPATPI